MCHPRIFRGRREKRLTCRQNGGIIRSDKPCSARSNSLRTLRRIAHHKHRNTEGGCLLLGAAAVRENEIRARHKIVKIDDVERRNQSRVRTAVESRVRRLSDRRVGMHGINEKNVGMRIAKRPHGGKHPPHRSPEAFPAVRRHEKHAASCRTFQHGMRIIRPYRRFQGVGHGIARNINALFRLSLPQKIFPCGQGRRKMIGGERRDGHAVEFLRKRRIKVACAQSRLHMSDRNFQIIAGK